jgi:putative transposase
MVVRVLESPAEIRGLPEVITVNIEPELPGKCSVQWAYRKVVKLSFNRPANPLENAFAESFNSRIQHEYLNDNRFLSIRY